MWFSLHLFVFIRSVFYVKYLLDWLISTMVVLELRNTTLKEIISITDNSQIADSPDHVDADTPS